MEININTSEKFESLISRFEKSILPKPEWTHEAHLAVAVWFNWHYDEETALSIVRRLIIAHNESVGTPNTDSEGYHETITRFWLEVCRLFVSESNASSPIEAHLLVMKSEICSSKYPMEFYTPEHLFTVKARHEWVEPNIKSWMLQ